MARNPKEYGRPKAGTRLALVALLLALGLVGLLGETRPSPTAAGPGGVSVRLMATTQVVPPDSSFAVDVVLDQGPVARGISAASFQLSFDPAVLRAIAFEVVTPLLRPREVVVDEGGATSSLVAAARTCEDAQRVPHQFTIARITFRAVGADGSYAAIDWRDAVALSPVGCGIRDLQRQDWDGISDNVASEAVGLAICVDDALARCDPPVTTPRLALAPRSGPGGQQAAVTASGYKPGEELTVTWDRGKTKAKEGRARGNPAPRRPRVIRVGAAAISSAGDARITFTVPRDAQPGSHRLVGTGTAGSRAVASFKVTTDRPRRDGADRGNDSRPRAEPRRHRTHH